MIAFPVQCQGHCRTFFFFTKKVPEITTQLICLGSFVFQMLMRNLGTLPLHLTTLCYLIPQSLREATGTFLN